ncbi:phosphate ABC transporter substrate-binding protein [filamentous cyanobacterium CCP5]|nr:phosphate ABC transporter substrate-binding protein [filamentous cyanobacterium CCP5]
MVKSSLQTILFSSLCVLLLTNCSAKTTEIPVSEGSEIAPEIAFEITTNINDADTIVLGDISDEPAKKMAAYQPFANHLAAQLKTVGIEAARVEVAPDIATMADWLASGKVDLYFDSPFPALMVSEASGGQPILRRWKDGVEAYHTIIFSRADGAVQTLEALPGQMIAFEEPFSTSGFMLPLAYLIEAGLNPREKAADSAPVAADEVGYVFSEDQKNAVQWVLTGRVAAAAVAAPDFFKIPADVRQRLTILAETEPLPRHLALVSPTLSDREVAAVKVALLALDEDEVGKSTLAAFEETAQFDEFPGGADQALSRMRELYDLTQREKE